MTTALKALCELRRELSDEMKAAELSNTSILLKRFQAQIILAAIADLTSGKWKVVPVENIVHVVSTSPPTKTGYEHYEAWHVDED